VSTCPGFVPDYAAASRFRVSDGDVRLKKVGRLRGLWYESGLKRKAELSLFDPEEQ
jgi:hypothetical protein